uniref:Uncharacterized protein n=1 Tax=Sphaerodactylus townsendi TaxID=933632 RepID=A0ACB8EQC0_9SAUR
MESFQSRLDWGLQSYSPSSCAAIQKLSTCDRRLGSCGCQAAGPVQTESSTGSAGSNRIRYHAHVCVQASNFDSQGALQLQVKGTNIQENEYVKMGAYHTIELEPNRQSSPGMHSYGTVWCWKGIEQALHPAFSADAGWACGDAGRVGSIVRLPRLCEEQRSCDYMFQQAVKTDNKLLLENRFKILAGTPSSDIQYALKEALCTQQ